jgi:hypothetical protein
MQPSRRRMTLRLRSGRSGPQLTFVRRDSSDMLNESQMGERMGHSTRLLNSWSCMG